LLIFGVDNDREHGDRVACAQYALHGIGQEEPPDCAPARMRRARESADECGRDGVVSRKLAGDLLRQVVDHERQRTETVEAIKELQKAS
jgi:hypothetical protein